MDKEIRLKFSDATLTGLAGFPYGKEIYENQVARELEQKVKNIIIFPKEIERVAISFFQGFTKDLIDKYGREEMLNLIEIRGNEKVVKKFYSVI